MSIITISREFGSGGRELGKRLSDELGFAYYDREIITAVAKELSMDENYLEKAAERAVFLQTPPAFSRTLMRFSSASVNGSYLLAQEHNIIRKLASNGDCVIVGRGANALLREQNPFSVFVYADMKSKISRCRARATEDENMTDREWERKIKQIDKARASNYALLSSHSWNNMHDYSLCVNTSGVDIKSIVPIVAHYAERWLERTQNGSNSFV